MEKTVKQRLMEFIYFKGISQSRFERLCGMSNGYINNLKKSLGAEKLQNILKAFPELNTEWILYGEGEMLKTTSSIITGDITIGDVNNSNISNVGHGNTYNVPACNHPHRECQCAIYPMLPDHVVRALDTNVEEWKKQNPGQCKMIDLRELIGEISHVQKMIGRVMEPDIPEGTLLFLRELNQWDEAMLDGSIYGVDIARPHMVVRRVFDDGDHIRCEPVNPIFGTVRIPKEKVMNLYKIAYGLKKFD